MWDLGVPFSDKNDIPEGSIKYGIIWHFEKIRHTNRQHMKNWKDNLP